MSESGFSGLKDWQDLCSACRKGLTEITQIL